MQKIDDVRHSLAHLLAAAVLKKFPEAKLGIGPVVENGFYYDFQLPHPLSMNDLKELKAEIRTLIRAALPFQKREVSVKEAKKLFQSQPFKLELIEDLEAKKQRITVYGTGDVFTDLCAGGHVKNTRDVNPKAFALTKIAGAYWKSDEENQQLTRIYGIAFATPKELSDYLTLLAEAGKRDHKKLGLELDLFVFSDLVGSGLPLFTPRGTIVREELTNFVQSLQVPLGYERVSIPHIAKRALYETSGHWQKFHDELFKINSREGHEFAVKPMNCPHHTQIYASRRRSYRELPIRYSEVTTVYRDEQSGELSGLSRVRALTQDDAHVFCRTSQIEKEVLTIWNIVDRFYAPFHMPLAVRFSRHNPKHMEKYLGTPKIWKETEAVLLSLLKKRRARYIDGLGEAAMYGPKIDFIAKDSLGREWQLATIQLDFNLPERFNLFCVNETGEEERVAMIHRAILGSIERFLSILIEHYAGNLPLWLSPVQVCILPIGVGHQSYAETIDTRLKALQIRSEIAASGETLGKRIRKAELQKIPYLAVVGDREIKEETANLRERHREKTGTLSLEKLIDRLLQEIKAKK